MDEHSDSRLDSSIDHARSSFDNAQDVIKFIDTKTAIVTGLNSILTGIPFLLFEWLFNQSTYSPLSFDSLTKSSPELMFASAVCGFLGLTTGILSLVFAIQALTARGPTSKYISILFPVIPPKRRHSAARSIRRLRSGITKTEIIRDYEHQLQNLGTILSLKISWLRRSLNALCLQVVSYGFSLLLLLLTAAL